MGAVCDWCGEPSPCQGFLAGFDADMECPHNHLGCDPRPHICDCWALGVNGVEKLEAVLRHQETRAQERHDQMLSALRALTETLAGLDRTQAVVAQAVLHPERNGR